MHSFKSYLLIFAIYLYSSSLIYGQQCGAAITPPTSTTVCSGTELTASPSGSGFIYQWQKDGVNIPNANAATYPLEESGSYTVIVRGTNCVADTSDAVGPITVTQQEAKFNADDKERSEGYTGNPLCGVPVTVKLENESTGDGLTYKWEITDSQGETLPTTIVQFIGGTTETSENPVLEFYEKGQYTVKLTITGPCTDPDNPEGPEDAVDPENPDAESDGRYVHEEQVIIVYPQVNPLPNQFCIDPATGPTITLTGDQLIGPPDANLGTITPNSFIWTVPAGVTISGDTQNENPTFVFPNTTGTYNITVSFSNECESSLGLTGQPTQITVTFTQIPPAPTLSPAETYVCEGGTYEIAPSGTNTRKLYNFYTSASGGTPLNMGGPASTYFAGPVNERSVFFVSAVEGNCESTERSIFTINVIQDDIENTITADQTICADTKPLALSGTNAQVGTNRPIYLWESRAEGESVFAPVADGDQQSYSPPVLTQTTTYRRTVTFEGCDIPNLSNEITIEVLPVIDPSTNVIQTDKEVVCKGDVPTLTGNLISGDIEYVWQSSTTSATTGFIPAVGSDNSNGEQFTPGFITQTTWYRRTAKYRNTNCDPVPSSEAIQVTIDELPAAPTVKATTASTCQGGSAVLEVEPNTTGTSPLTYVWYTEASGGTPIGSGSPFTTPPLAANTTFYVEAVNANECVSLRRTSVMVTVLPITADAGRDTTIIEGQSTTLKGTGVTGATYSWSPATGLSNPNVANPVATPTETTTYTLTVTNGDQECVATDEVTITVIPRIRIVNTFSPNNDGVNEVWEIENIQNFPEATVEIFNRYGAQVFKSTNGYTQPWNGTHNGNPLPLATYYYIIHLNKTEKPFTGSITIIK